MVSTLKSQTLTGYPIIETDKYSKETKKHVIEKTERKIDLLSEATCAYPECGKKKSLTNILKKCGACKAVLYCPPPSECQKSHWKASHKNECGKKNPTPTTKPSTETSFWKKVEAIPTIARENEPIIINGKTVFRSLAEGRLEMFISSNLCSTYVINYLVKSSLSGIVLDLGCGTGANSIPLFKKGWKVIAIDNEPKVLREYKDSIIKSVDAIKTLKWNPEPTLINEDITICKYPENIDAVICVDVLSHIPPASLKTTLSKIFTALRPGGRFIGTLFFKSTNEENPYLELMSKLGGHFYPEKEFVQEILRRSGFQILKEDERASAGAKPYCLEFLAEKPLL